ncbi:MAG: sulfatase-like hydrolase/transferase [Planctomycetota bacterium]
MNLSKSRLSSVSLALAAVLLTSLGTTPSAAGSSAGEPARKPNFLVVLADDLGYGDLGCYGHPRIKTPNLDRLADEGIRLTNCYAAAANCSPARTGLMTGRTPYRVGIHNWIPMFSPMHVRRTEITVATLLRQDGYATCHVGKWHLNGAFNLPGQPQPSDHGFDHWFSTQNNALPCHHNPDNFVRNGKPVGPLEGFSAPLVVEEATRWLREGRDRQKPFFLFVCFHEPHEPIATDKRFSDMYPSDDPSLSTHHGNVTQADDAFGRLMAAVDELGLRDDTLVMFTSDNGPAITSWHPHGSPGPLREKKGHVYEGGIRVPGILRWPGHAKPGTVCDEPVSGVDLLPTLCEIAGVAVPDDRAIDGASFLPILEGNPIPRKTPLYWQFNFAPTKPKVAMRVGDWKILASLTEPDVKPGADITPEIQASIKRAEPATFELYNLREDVGETTDLAEKEPERAAAMSAQLQKLYHEVRDESPVWPAWEWARYEGGRIQAARKAGVWPEWKKPAKPK